MTRLEHSKQHNPRNVTIQVRARQAQRDLIDRAAHVLGRNRSDFLLDAACREAESVLLDQRIFSLNEDVYSQFVAALDSPPIENEKLKNLLRQKAPWE